VLDGTVIGPQRHRHREFMSFLNAFEQEVSAAKVIHTVPDKPEGRGRDEVKESIADTNPNLSSGLHPKPFWPSPTVALHYLFDSTHSDVRLSK
jgi:hypothetical protein